MKGDSEAEYSRTPYMNPVPENSWGRGGEPMRNLIRLKHPCSTAKQTKRNVFTWIHWRLLRLTYFSIAECSEWVGKKYALILKLLHL